MINHARTLLLNLPGGASGYAAYPGEEYIPSNYPGVKLGSLGAVYRILFGSNPDRVFLNYRVRQLMNLLHSTELRDYVLQLDNRVTYDISPFDELFYSLFQVQIAGTLGTVSPGGLVHHYTLTGQEYVTIVAASSPEEETFEATIKCDFPESWSDLQYTLDAGETWTPYDNGTYITVGDIPAGYNEDVRFKGRVPANAAQSYDLVVSAIGANFDLESELVPVKRKSSLALSAGPLYLLGDFTPDVQQGRCYLEWYVEVISSSTVRIIRRVPPVTEEISEFTTTDNLSSPVTLPWSDLSVRFTPYVGASWRIHGYARPTRSLGDLENELKQLGEPLLIRLFRVTSSEGQQEPYVTFRKCWQFHPEQAMRLAGLLLAYIYRVETLRVAA